MLVLIKKKFAKLIIKCSIDNRYINYIVHSFLSFLSIHITSIHMQTFFNIYSYNDEVVVLFLISLIFVNSLPFIATPNCQGCFSDFFFPKVKNMDTAL